MPQTHLAAGVDFGGTSVKIGVAFRGNVVDQAPPIATADFDGPDALIETIIEVVSELRQKHPRIAAVGVGVPGFVDFEKGMVHNLTNVPGWEGIKLKRILGDRLDLPVAIDNDANCMAYAEWKRGAGRGLDDLIAITLGTGVGGGVVANGAMVRGARFGAGEVGQMSIDYQGTRGTYGNLGALEEYVGNQQIAEMAHQAFEQAGEPRSESNCTPAELSRLARQGDAVALEIWDRVATKLASALMSCCWLLNPQAIIIGGGVAKAGELLFGPLTSHLYAQLSPPFKDHLMILPARFGNEAGMIGAAALSLDSAGMSYRP